MTPAGVSQPEGPMGHQTEEALELGVGQSPVQGPRWEATGLQLLDLWEQAVC